jgi:hypothetical protein
MQDRVRSISGKIRDRGNWRDRHGAKGNQIKQTKQTKQTFWCYEVFQEQQTDQSVPTH